MTASSWMAEDRHRFRNDVWAPEEDMFSKVFFFFFHILSHFYVGSMCLMRRLHLARSCASSIDNSLSDKSFLMLSNYMYLRFGLPLLLFPGTSIAITLLPTCSSSLLNTCSYHFNLLSCTFLDISPTFVVPIILSFLILSSMVTQLIHHYILISATFNFFCWAFFTSLKLLLSEVKVNN